MKYQLIFVSLFGFPAFPSHTFAMHLLFQSQLLFCADDRWFKRCASAFAFPELLKTLACQTSFGTSLIKLVYAKFVCSTFVYKGSGFPIHVHPSGVSLAKGSPGLPLTSSYA